MIVGVRVWPMAAPADDVSGRGGEGFKGLLSRRALTGPGREAKSQCVRSRMLEEDVWKGGGFRGDAPHCTAPAPSNANA
jgi:hypothetical protein